MPAVLQRLMRHESIETTMGYYVDLDADELAEDLYRADETREKCQEGKGLGKTDDSGANSAIRAVDLTPCEKKVCIK